MGDRDPANYHEASHWPDVAEGCDTLGSHVAELVNEEWPRKADERAKAAVIALVTRVVHRLLDEGRLAPLVDVKRLPGKELLARLLDEIIHAPDPLVMAYCVDFVMETGAMLGVSMTKIGALCEVTKSTVSHHCRHLTVTYRGGKPARGMKSEEAVSSYRKGRLGKSSRGPRIEWQFADTFAKHYGPTQPTHSGRN
jgi:hypothetical protein